MQTIGELVDQLFKTHLRPDGKEYTYQEVSASLEGELDPTNIGKLRRGQIPNPSRNTLKLLCLFFRVPPSYFFPELETLDPPGIAPKEEPLRALLRSMGLAPETQAHLVALVKALQVKDRQQ